MSGFLIRRGRWTDSGFSRRGMIPVRAAEATATFDRKSKPVSRRQSPIGEIVRTEDTGPNRSRARIVGWRGPGREPRDVRVQGESVALTREDVKETIRRIRPQEAERLDEINRQIAELKEAREALLREAWSKAHAVTVKEIADAAERRLDDPEDGSIG